jgi:acetaldehyde dehydrogenase (acetylating)
MDKDLHSIQQARTLLRKARKAFETYHTFSQEQVDRIVAEMVRAGIAASESLAKLAHEETGFGRIESKIQKNLFATRTLSERMQGMKTCGVIRKSENGSIWEIASPMGIVAALVPSTNPTSTAMYKAIIAAKARCGIVLSPHPRSKKSTLEALHVVAHAAYKAGAPEGLFGCMTAPSIEGTNALLEDADTDLILATGGSAMVHAAYSKGKPAYGVGSGNVPVYVDRSADLSKAAADMVYGVSFDWGTLCSTERSIVVDSPALPRLKDALKHEQAHILTDEETVLLRKLVAPGGRLNIDQVGKSPSTIARMAGFSVPESTRALVAYVETVGKAEPLSMETLSPILSMYSVEGWEEGCQRCKEILAFGGIGHTLAIHASSKKVIEAFALEKPAMRIVVNTVAALGSVGFTTDLFPAMTLGPGAMGGSITSDNISPLHLINIKRLAFETNAINATNATKPVQVLDKPRYIQPITPLTQDGRPSKPWMDEIDARLRMRAGNPRSNWQANRSSGTKPKSPSIEPLEVKSSKASEKKPDAPSLSESDVERIAAKFRKR